MEFTDLLREETRSKKISIRILAGLSGFTLLLAILYFLIGLNTVAYLNLSTALLAPLAIVLTKRGYFLLTKIFMHILVLFVILVGNCIYSSQSLVLTFLVPLVQSALTVFNKKEWPWAAGFLAIIMGLVPLIIILDYRILPIEMGASILRTVQLLNVVGSIGFAAIQISFASSVNEEFRQILEIRNQESEDRSQLLMSALSTRDKLFNILAHDLRSPFIALQSGFGILEDYPVPEDKKWILNEIRENTRNTLSLLDNTLAWARSQTDNILFSPKEIPVKEIIGKLSNNFSFHCRAKNINVHLETGDKIHAFADPDMFASILQNLISNAIKFTPKGGDIWISAVAVSNGTEFRIRDSGTGMTNEEIEQILSGGTFSKPGTGREKGHGVGLLLVREFLSRHDCALVIKSAKDMGTEFSFMLPHSAKSVG